MKPSRKAPRTARKKTAAASPPQAPSKVVPINAPGGRLKDRFVFRLSLNNSKGSRVWIVKKIGSELVVIAGPIHRASHPKLIVLPKRTFDEPD
jgi:hypothetical protein